MIFHSVIPVEMVFEEYYRNIDNKTMVIDYLNEKVEVQPLEDNQFVIRRLLSTSPGAYLDSRLQPGLIIKR